MATEVVMPQMGESIAEGTITKWLKSVGEHVERDEPLFEISTDKVDAEIPSPAAGTLTEVRFKEGDTVEVNTVVALLDGAGATSGGATASAAVPDENRAEQKAPARETTSAPPPEQTPPPAKTELPPQQAQSPLQPKPVEPVPTPPAPQRQAPPSTPADRLADDGGSGATAEELRRTKSSPLVRKIAQEHGVDIGKLEGTGLSGRVTKNDILSFIESGSASPVTEPKAAA